jgi:hypothetical protein
LGNTGVGGNTGNTGGADRAAASCSEELTLAGVPTKGDTATDTTALTLVDLGLARTAGASDAPATATETAAAACGAAATLLGWITGFIAG